MQGDCVRSAACHYPRCPRAGLVAEGPVSEQAGHSLHGLLGMGSHDVLQSHKPPAGLRDGRTWARLGILLRQPR